MVITDDVELPSYEELTVQEVNLSTPYLKAASFFLGKQCEAENNEFMLCRGEEKDPRKCLKEGKAVTACSLKFFQMVKSSCAEELTDYATCLDKSSYDMHVQWCRNTQAVFDSCMLSKFGMPRPHIGYFNEARIHTTNRPKPCTEPPPVYADAVPEIPPDSIPRNPAKYGVRKFLGS